MATSATTSFRVERDLEGPSRARAAVSRSLRGRVPATTLHDVLLVVSELVANAVIHGQGEIDVRAELADGQVRGEVRDRGPGVHEADRERIFDAFERGTDTARGSGLGLAIARGFAEANGGRVWVEPSASGGALFVLELPRVVRDGAFAP